MKNPSFNQYAYHLSSISEGLYFAEISIYRKITHFYGRNGRFPVNNEFEKMEVHTFTICDVNKKAILLWMAFLLLNIKELNSSIVINRLFQEWVIDRNQTTLLQLI